MRLPSRLGPPAYDPAAYELFRRLDQFHLRSLAQHARRGLRAIDQQDELPRERPRVLHMQLTTNLQQARKQLMFVTHR